MLIEVGAVALGRKINLGRMKKERERELLAARRGATGVELSRAERSLAEGPLQHFFGETATAPLRYTNFLEGPLTAPLRYTFFRADFEP